MSFNLVNILFSLVTDLKYYIVEADSKKIYVQDIPPDRPFYLYIDYQYIEWYKINVGKDIVLDDVLTEMVHYITTLTIGVHSNNK